MLESPSAPQQQKWTVSLLHPRGGILIHSCLRIGFNSATLEGFWAWMACLRSQSDLSPDFDLFSIIQWWTGWCFLGHCPAASPKYAWASGHAVLVVRRCDRTQTLQNVKLLVNLRQAFVYSAIDGNFAQFLCLCCIWTLTLTETSEACSSCSGFFCDLLDESSMCFWSNFGRLATPGKDHHSSKFLPFVYNDSHCGSLDSQSLRNDFISLSRLIDINDFVSQPFLLIIARCVGFLKSFSLLHFVRQLLWLITEAVNSWFNKGSQLLFRTGPSRFW